MSIQFQWRRWPALLLAVAWALSGCASSSSTQRIEQAGPAAATRPAPTKPAAVVAAPTDIRTFSPEESAVGSPIAADKIDLRKIFEELGPDAALWYQHVQTLANPFFEGRAPDTRGGELAANYIQFFFEQSGLEPAFTDQTTQPGGEETAVRTSYVQPFDFRSPNPEIEVVKAEMSINGRSITQDSEFTVLGISGNGAVSAPVTFVGYGIEKGKEGYTSFDEDTDLAGRIALVLRYEPLDEQGKSLWSAARFSRHASIAPKMASLAERGAAGILLVNPPGAVDGKTGLESVKDSGRFGKRLDIPVFQISPQVAERMLAAGDPERRDLMHWRRLADTGEARAVHLDAALQVSLASTLNVDDRLETQNVAGVLSGKGALADQWVVIGAHFDHVGFGYTGARPQNIGKLHPGADDNASGIGAMLIAAQRVGRRYQEAGDDTHLRSVLFIAFGAEEAGLHGSKYFVEHSPVTNEATTLMINMDMVGRLRSNNLLVQGTGTAEGLADILQPLFAGSGLTISATPGGLGPSDHSSFYGKDIPVLFLFTGDHAEYHQPTDLAHTVNPAGALKVIGLLEAITMEMAGRSQRLTFTQSAGGLGGRDTGAKVSLGTMPDYTAELETGMRVEAVRDGSSAAEAGIQSGDVLLTWNDQEIAGPRSLSDFLAKHEPGDRVKIVLLRGETEITVEAVLQARAAQ